MIHILPETLLGVQPPIEGKTTFLELKCRYYAAMVSPIMIKSRWLRLTLAAGLILLSTISQLPAQAAIPAPPKVGQCYLYSEKDFFSNSSSLKPISCSKLHNIETVFVKKMRWEKNPKIMIPVDFYNLGERTCQVAIEKDQRFTGWSAKAPTESQWKKGASWIRCDGYRSQLDENGIPTYESWVGKNPVQR